MNIETKLNLLGAVFSGLFTGAAIYINVVEHPSRMSCSIDVAHKQWAPSFKRASFWMPTQAFLGFIVGLVNYFKHSNTFSLRAGLFLIAVVPLTSLIMPTNKILLGKQELNDETKRSLLQKWANLHTLRSITSLVSFGIFLYALTKK